MGKIVSIHQPNYIPWLGYFYKMAHCDIFVYLDSVQYPRGKSFAARNKIKTANGSSYLTIPVTIPAGKKGKALYTEISFADNKWHTKHLKTIELNYKKSVYFEEIFNLYKTLLEQSLSFTDLNISMIEAFANYLDIKTKRIRLSELLHTFRQKSEMIIDICKVLGADTYLSGNGSGKEYNDVELLNRHGIKLVYSDFQHPEYKQLWGNFEPSMSVIDLLFNKGPESKLLFK